MALLAPDTEIVRAADGRAHAEGAGDNSPRLPAPSGYVDELPSVVASVERIDAWMEMAAAGDVFVYATRARLPIASAGRKRMLDLAKRNLVCLTQVRSKIDPAIFSYRATRTTTPTAMTKPVRSTLTAHLVDAEAALVDALLPVLSRAARFARPCPTDKQLAERTQLPIASIQPGLAALSAAGLIRVEALPAPTRRRVIIIATGAQTGLIA